MVDDSEFSIRLFDLELGGSRLDAQRVVVCRINHHGSCYVERRREKRYVDRNPDTGASMMPWCNAVAIFNVFLATMIST